MLKNITIKCRHSWGQNLMITKLSTVKESFWFWMNQPTLIIFIIYVYNYSNTYIYNQEKKKIFLVFEEELEKMDNWFFEIVFVV